MNNAIDLSGLIRGVLAVIGIALALGQYPKLEHWSREQAAESIAWKRGLPHGNEWGFRFKYEFMFLSRRYLKFGVAPQLGVYSGYEQMDPTESSEYNGISKSGIGIAPGAFAILKIGKPQTGFLVRGGIEFDSRLERSWSQNPGFPMSDYRESRFITNIEFDVGISF